MTDPSASPSPLTAIDSKAIRQFLVELTKARVEKLLNTASDQNLDHVSFSVIGTSARQVSVVRMWIARVVAPTIDKPAWDALDTLMTDLDDGQVPLDKAAIAARLEAIRALLPGAAARRQDGWSFSVTPDADDDGPIAATMEFSVATPPDAPATPAPDAPPADAAHKETK